MHLLNDNSFFPRQHLLISKTLMVLLNCFHSRYTALLFFHSVPQEVPRPHLTLSLLYPAKSLIQQLEEDNQCPSHLSLSSSLLLISSLKGDQLVHFFHDNIAEASLLHILQILFPTEAISLVFPVVLLLSSHCIFLSLSFRSTPLFLRALLAPLRLFICFVTFVQLPCFQGDYLNLFPIIPIQSVSCFYRIS